jgi:hypothetical protein
LCAAVAINIVTIVSIVIYIIDVVVIIIVVVIFVIVAGRCHTTAQSAPGSGVVVDSRQFLSAP